MPKERNIIQEVLRLIQQLEQERAQHRQRIDEIDSALTQIRGGSIAPSPASPRRGRPPGSKNAPAKSSAPTGQGGRGGNSMSFREAAAQVTAKQPLSVREIVEAVQKIGYKFQSADPIKSVGAYLYGKEGKKHFKRADGKFSAEKGPIEKGNGRSAQPAKAKRTMSPESRKKIAEAVRARWAKQKAGKK
jgi:hypothetical protein